MTTTFETLAISTLHAHPKNPRRRAVADDAMVAAFKERGGPEQPLVVAPSTEHDGEHTVIAGHRRLASAKKARLKELGCVIRTDLDTETKQLEAMLLENSSRIDLTPIEEAEGYQALLELGLTQKVIAERTGRDRKTVSSRLRLLKLTASTQKKVHAGQVTIDDSLALVEFADDPEATSKLERASGTPNFKYVLQQAKQRRKVMNEISTTVADLEQRGITAAFTPKDESEYYDGIRTPSGRQLIRADDLDSHEGHVGYVINPGNSWNHPSLTYVCTAPGEHDVDADQAAADAAAEESRLRHEQRRAERAAASTVRLDEITEAAAAALSSAGPDAIAFVQATLPALALQAARFSDSDRYAERLGLEGTDWSTYSKVGERNWLDHLADLEDASPARLARILVEVLALNADRIFARSVHLDRGLSVAVTAPYVGLLDALGHAWQDVEQDDLTAARPGTAGDKAVSA